MKVRATLPEGNFGFYGTQRRYDGDEFDIDENHFSENWMVKVETKRKPGPKPKQKEEGGE